MGFARGIRAQLFAVPVVGTVALSALLVQTQWQARRIEAVQQRIEDHEMPAMETARLLRNRLEQYQRALQDAVAEEDPGLGNAPELAREIRSRAGARADIAAYLGLSERVSRRMAMREPQGQLLPALIEMSSRWSELAMTLTADERSARAGVGRAFASARALRRRMALTSALTITISALALLAMTAWMSRRITQPLTQLTGAADRIAHADFALDPPAISGAAEMVALSEAFRRMLHELRARDTAVARSNAQLRESLTQLQRAQTQLVTSDRLVSLGVLAAGVAHEINNPLAYVSANLGYAIKEMKSTAGLPEPDWLEEVQSSLGDALEGSQRIATIVRDLQLISREGDRDGQHPVDLHRVINAALNVARNHIERKATVDTDLRPVPAVRGRAAHLGQAMLNLLMNAAQSMDTNRPGNRIRVATRTLPDGSAAIFVEDTGCGIPETLRQRIFDPFFTTKPVGQGTGLGLSICHGIITGMGGTIEVDSEVGHGSIFRVVLPAV